MQTAVKTAPNKTAAATRRHRCWWQVAGQAVALAVVVLSGLELFFNACGVGLEEILQPDPTFGTKHIPNKHVVWRMEGFSNEYFSAAGLRDQAHAVTKPVGTYRVALLGDSATEGLQVRLEETYGRKLEKLLNFGGKTEVINFGCSGYSTGQEVLQFEQQVEQYKPDLTILLYNRGDNTENTRKPWDLKVEPRPYFYFDAQKRLQEDDGVLAANKQALQPNPVVDFLRKNSRIYGVFSHANLTLSINEPFYRKVRGWVLFPFTAQRPPAAQAAPVYMPQDSTAVTLALIKRLNADCKQSGSKLLVVAFPNQVNDPEFSQQIAALAKLSQQEQFGFHDLTPAFHWKKDTQSYFLKYHFSGKGHSLVAAEIVRYFADVQRSPAKP